MNVMKWLIGVPVGIFVLMVVYQLIKPVEPKLSFLDQQIADCRSKAGSEYVTGNKTKAILLQADCDTLERAQPKK